MAASELVESHYAKLQSQSLSEDEMKKELAVPCL